MQAQTVNRIVAITVFGVATYRMTHIGRMHADLVLASRLQFIFHQRMLCGTIQNMEMRDSQFADIIYR